MLQLVHKVLENPDEEFPRLAGREYQIVGLGWRQGWNEGLKMARVQEYEGNLANLIRDLRRDLPAEKLKAVIAVSGFGGWNQKVDRRLSLPSMASPDGMSFRGLWPVWNPRGFFRPPEESLSRQGYH